MKTYTTNMWVTFHHAILINRVQDNAFIHILYFVEHACTSFETNCRKAIIGLYVYTYASFKLFNTTFATQNVIKQKIIRKSIV